MFEIGKKVICINDMFPVVDGDKYEPDRKPKKHEVLEVAAIYDHENFGLFLAFDIFNTPENNCWFIAKHFRPFDDLRDFQEQTELQESQERIEIIEPILT